MTWKITSPRALLTSGKPESHLRLQTNLLTIARRRATDDQQIRTNLACPGSNYWF